MSLMSFSLGLHYTHPAVMMREITETIVLYLLFLNCYSSICTVTTPTKKTSADTFKHIILLEVVRNWKSGNKYRGFDKESAYIHSVIQLF